MVGELGRVPIDRSLKDMHVSPPSQRGRSPGRDSTAARVNDASGVDNGDRPSSNLMSQARILTGNLLASQGVCACKLPVSAPLTSHHCAPSALLLAIQRLIEETDRPRGNDDFAVLVDNSSPFRQTVSGLVHRAMRVQKGRQNHFREKDRKHCL